MRTARMRRALVPVALAGLVLVPGSVLAAGALPALASPAAYSISISAADKLGPYYGYTLVFYKATQGFETATISGQVTGAAPGDVAELLAEPFGATQYSSTGMQVTLAPTGTTPVAYSFDAKPSLATSYEVEVLTGTQVDVTSQTRTVYVGVGGFSRDERTHCSAGKCTTSWKAYSLVPASAFQTEFAKRHFYFYFALAKHEPTYLYRDNRHASATNPRKINGGEFVSTLFFHYATRLLHPQPEVWSEFCLKDTESVDGMGLPRPTGCGARRVFTYVYIG